MDALQQGHPDMAIQSFIRGWTGFAMGGIGGQTESAFNLFDTLNPLNMSEAPAWKSMFWSGILMRVVKKVVKTDPMSKIPIVGKWVKFS
jgi:hypothetical protein